MSFPAQTKAVTERRPVSGRAILWSAVKRIGSILLLAFVIGWILHLVSDRLHTRGEMARFPQGVIQGALMPMALPNLVVGNDVPIYSTYNNGVPYKLGYTVGVNGCGALFFGFFFWRVKRWRHPQAAP